MFNKNLNGEVSNKLILLMTLIVVSIVILGPLALFIILPALLDITKTEVLQVVFEDDFESYDPSVPGGWPPYDAKWVAWSSGKGVALDDQIKKSGKRSIRMHGTGASSGIYRKLGAKPPFTLEFDVRMGSEPFNRGGHQFRAGVYHCEEGRMAHGRDFVHFMKGNDVRVIGKVFSDFKWKPDRWYHVRIDYKHEDGSYWVDAEVGGKKFKTLSMGLTNWQKKWDAVLLVFHSGMGTSWFDNIRLYRRVKK
ncbi:MAG: hypothetical protein E3J72_13630 [Planctomycetota bacterium]|nr:MAG: hypothetical protein E3J72_13630 [Planctomycetota bacterium]